MLSGDRLVRPCVKRWLVYEGGKLSVVCLDYNGSPHMTIIDGARFGNQVSRNMMYALDLELHKKVMDQSVRETKLAKTPEMSTPTFPGFAKN